MSRRGESFSDGKWAEGEEREQNSSQYSFSFPLFFFRPATHCYVASQTSSERKCGAERDSQGGAILYFFLWVGASDLCKLIDSYQAVRADKKVRKGSPSLRETDFRVLRPPSAFHYKKKLSRSMTLCLLQFPR